MTGYTQTKRERLQQLRLSLLVHSYLYYHRNETLISDHQWQSLANELVELQRYRHYINCYDVPFKDWDASTGYHLPADQWVQHKAEYLLKLHQSPLPRRRSILAV